MKQIHEKVFFKCIFLIFLNTFRQNKERTKMMTKTKGSCKINFKLFRILSLASRIDDMLHYKTKVSPGQAWGPSDEPKFSKQGMSCASLEAHEKKQRQKSSSHVTLCFSYNSATEDALLIPFILLLLVFFLPCCFQIWGTDLIMR